MDNKIITILRINSNVTHGEIIYKGEIYKGLSVKISSLDYDESFKKLKEFMIDFRDNFSMARQLRKNSAIILLNLINEALYFIDSKNNYCSESNDLISVSYQIKKEEIFDFEI